ncbi:MAG: hypothetical protein A2896_01280 [Candidatus Nealsonbacteria bacterium RIFCSPLOWO2_01_FULL_43_32]|uniref:Fimbrial assembly protein n=1 Tax=Candidatus Nealsonbacteria bacterium RIFCSPLOWO2_01_FULL_43_32 TaxID=1801672 RepID=A0A1G2EGE0_9BACT|nr:MAG: hypothetical protein A2896_01280 [Candidatus Nealsonbacteria bacterium RIFCSPLOWO2_01_FULL_43_32]
MVGIIPKTVKKTPQWQNFVAYFCYALLIGLVLGYALLFYLEGKAISSLQNLEEKITQVATPEDRVAESMILATKKRINDFSTLLQDHKKSSNFLSFLEVNTLPKVWLTKLELNPAEAKALVSGQAPDFKTLGQQILILQGQEQVQSVDLTNLSIGKKGETVFSFDLYFNPQILQ